MAKFDDYKFGIALAAMSFGDPIIEDIAIVDGTVLARENRNVVTSILMESHKFFTFRNTGPNFGVGPFVAASLVDGDTVNPLSMFATGIMIGWRREDSSASWNVGFGWIVNTDVLEFREGVSDGATTTLMNAADLTRTVDQDGVVVLFSASW